MLPCLWYWLLSTRTLPSLARSLQCVPIPQVSWSHTHTHIIFVIIKMYMSLAVLNSHAMYKAGPLPLLPERASVAIHDHMARFEHHDPFIVSQHMGTTKPLPPRSLDMWDFYTSMHLSLKYSSSHILIRMVINVHHQGPAHVGGVHPRQGAWKAKQLFVKRQVWRSWAGSTATTRMSGWGFCTGRTGRFFSSSWWDSQFFWGTIGFLGFIG